MVKAESKDVGDRATPQWTWTVDGTATDPGQIVVKQQTPAGVESTVTTASNPSSLTTSSTPLARMSAGVFRLNPGIALNAHGYWLVRAEATGTAESAAPDFLYKVQPTEFSDDAGIEFHALVGLQETKDWLQQQNIDFPDTLELVRVINDSSARFIEESETEFRNYESTSTATVRLFDVDFSSFYGMRVNVGAMASAPTLVRVLAEDGSVAATVTDYVSHPRTRKPWQPISFLQLKTFAFRPQPNYSVEVTGVFGYPSVPGDVKQAVLDAIAATMDRDVEHYRQDLGPEQQGEGQNVIVFGARPLLITMPPSSLAVARRYQGALVG